MPKSLDVSKAIDKFAGVDGEYGEKKANVHSRGNHVLHDGWKRPWQDNPDAVDKSGRVYVPGSDAARQWQGWGTSLKPALEPITVARKPVIGTVAQNVLTHGTGALNIDGCRINTEDSLKRVSCGRIENAMQDSKGMFTPGREAITTGGDAGRFPANLIHDGSPEVLELFPESNGAGKSLPNVKITGYGDKNTGNGKSEYFGGERIPFDAGSGSAARFFYCAKTSKKDRGEDNNHPTVKPTDLMRYLCRLVTPPGGTVLDPFMGSGSTGKAAILEGFNFIGCEMDENYVKIAQKRIKDAEDSKVKETSPSLTSLFE
jgi:site-specific DNA-methyltransferase (adenine-specific)